MVDKLVIKRGEWLRGEGSSASFLLRVSDNKKCCLGFLGLACGIPEDKLVNCDTPIHSDKDSFPEFLFGAHKIVLSHDCSLLMHVNDDKYISESNREAQLIGIFESHGIELKFES